MELKANLEILIDLRLAAAGALAGAGAQRAKGRRESREVSFRSILVDFRARSERDILP